MLGILSGILTDFTMYQVEHDERLSMDFNSVLILGDGVRD